jgi:hypothetical protein
MTKLNHAELLPQFLVEKNGRSFEQCRQVVTNLLGGTRKNELDVRTLSDFELSCILICSLELLTDQIDGGSELFRIVADLCVSRHLDIFQCVREHLADDAHWQFRHR